jgi:hypothetical protein
MGAYKFIVMANFCYIIFFLLEKKVFRGFQLLKLTNISIIKYNM